MPVNVQITDTEIIVTAENGTVVGLNRRSGVVLPPDRPWGHLTPSKPSAASKRIRARLHADAVQNSVQVSPRWTLRVGDTVMAQHKKGGRKFRTTVKAIKPESGQTFVQVADPRNGGTYLLALDRIARTRS